MEVCGAGRPATRFKKNQAKGQPRVESEQRLSPGGRGPWSSTHSTRSARARLGPDTPQVTRGFQGEVQLLAVAKMYGGGAERKRI